MTTLQSLQKAKEGIASEKRKTVAVSYTHLDAADERSSVDLGGRRIIKKKTKKKGEDREI